MFIKLLRYSDFGVNEADLSILSENELISFGSFKSEKRKAEYYFTRVLWRSFGLTGRIEYDELGRPTVENGYVSISHSRDLILIGYHPDHPVGVDAEYISSKIKLIREKFIDEDDRQFLDFESLRDLTIVWSIKEAVYKMERIPGLSFAQNIHVNVSSNVPEVIVIKGRERHIYQFSYIARPDFVLTFCTHASLNGVMLF